MNEKDLQVFVDGTVHYFSRVSSEAALVDAPFLREDNSEVLDYTGAICISGTEKGYVFFTATRDMISELLDTLGEPMKSPDDYLDVVGEVANTISGNARKVFGGSFAISVPFVLEPDRAPDIPPNAKSFVIPILWGRHKAYLIIALQSSPK